MEQYGLDYSIKSFAVANNFVMTANQACYELGKSLRPFSIFSTDIQKQYGLLDIMAFDGFSGTGKTIADEIAETRQVAYRESGINVDINDAMKRRLLVFDYLMTVSLCYVEIPKYITKDGMHVQSYDKFLCTRNPAIMAAWMGAEPAEMQAKYSARIMSRQVEFNDNFLRFVKLNHSAKGNSITVPRNAASVEKMTCVPLFMLYAFVEGFRPKLESGILKFSFTKDNGTVRELASTLSEDIVRQYYDDNMFISTMLSGVDFKSVQQGGMTVSSKIHRGYVRLPELGASVYDSTGTRSLNLARILKVEEVSEVDRTFIKVDLNSVVANFDTSLDYLAKNQPTVVKDCYVALVGDDVDASKFDSVAQMVEACKTYVAGRSAFLSTSFHRDLHKFLISHPTWFPLYTGKPAQTIVSSANYGVEMMDF